MNMNAYYSLLYVTVHSHAGDEPERISNITFLPTRFTQQLMAKENLVALSRNGVLGLYFKDEYNAIPTTPQNFEVNFHGINLFFTIDAKEAQLLSEWSDNAADEAAGYTQFTYKLTDINDPDVSLELIKVPYYAAVFSHQFTAAAGTKNFQVLKDGVPVTIGGQTSSTVTSNEDGVYNCSADLTGMPAGYYQLKLGTVAPVTVYIDVENELAGKTGLLELVLNKYNYIMYYSSPSPPPHQKVDPVLLSF